MSDDFEAPDSISSADGMGLGITLDPDDGKPVLLLWVHHESMGMVGTIFSPVASRQLAAAICNFADDVESLQGEVEYLSEEEVKMRLDAITSNFGGTEIEALVEEMEKLDGESGED